MADETVSSPKRSELSCPALEKEAVVTSSQAMEVDIDLQEKKPEALCQNQGHVSSNITPKPTDPFEKQDIAFKSPDLISFKVPSQKKTMTPTSSDKETRLNSPQNEATSNIKAPELVKSIDAPSDNKPESKTNPVQKQTKALPSQPANLKEVPLAYIEPKWGGVCEGAYRFEIIKNGKEIGNYDLASKSVHVFGRLPSCDHMLEHPSLSRHHAVVQYCASGNDRHQKGWYLYDLESTHGTVVNKVKLKPRVYHRLRVGFVVKFAGSSRLFLLQGPEEDQENESELSIKEIKEKKREKEEAKLLEKMTEEEAMKSRQEDVGCTWGISMADESEEPDMDKNPFSIAEPKNEDLYIDDPKKALKGFFEREGYDLPEYEFLESSFGKHTCRVELPFDLLSTPEGESMYAEASVSGKKKDCVVHCALEACRILDKHDLLRQAKHESRAKKKKNWEEQDFYGSDDDTFLDRTGDIERKRKLRMKMFGHNNEKAQNYESLKKQLDEVEENIAEKEGKLMQAKSEMQSREDDGLDALDAYMSAIKSGTIDTKTRTAVKRELLELRREQQRLQRLVNIAKPSLTPALNPSVDTKNSLPLNQKLPMMGKMKGRKTGVAVSTSTAISKAATTHPPTQQQITESANAEEEEEEEEENATALESSSSSATPTVKTATRPIDHSERTNSDSVASDVTECVQNDSDPVTGVAAAVGQPVSKQPSIGPPVSASVAVTKDQTTIPTQHSQSLTGLQSHEPQSSQNGEDTLSSPTKKRKRHHKVPAKADLSKIYCDDDPDYATWLPPQDQAGDGKTHLNAKYGY